MGVLAELLASIGTNTKVRVIQPFHEGEPDLLRARVVQGPREAERVEALRHPQVDPGRCRVVPPPVRVEKESPASRTSEPVLLFLGNLGMQEILLIGLFVLIFFGAKKIPEFMRGLGKGVREFKDSIKDVKKDIEDAGAAAKIEEGK